MNESEVRALFVSTARKYIGCRESDGETRAITMNEALSHGDLTNMAYFRISVLSIDSTSKIYIE